MGAGGDGHDVGTANLARLVGWFLALMDSTCRAFVWRHARRLPGDARAPDALPKWWLGESETPPVAIVTGAGSGIGFATAKRLHALGARVAVVCATLAEAEATSARIAEQAEAEAGAGPGRDGNAPYGTKKYFQKKRSNPPRSARTCATEPRSTRWRRRWTRTTAQTRTRCGAWCTARASCGAFFPE